MNSSREKPEIRRNSIGLMIATVVASAAGVAWAWAAMDGGFSGAGLVFGPFLLFFSQLAAAAMLGRYRFDDFPAIYLVLHLLLPLPLFAWPNYHPNAELEVIFPIGTAVIGEGLLLIPLGLAWILQNSTREQQK